MLTIHIYIELYESFFLVVYYLFQETPSLIVDKLSNEKSVNFYWHFFTSRGVQYYIKEGIKLFGKVSDMIFKIAC